MKKLISIVLFSIFLMTSCSSLKYKCYGYYNEENKTGELIWFTSDDKLLSVDICPYEGGCWYSLYIKNENVLWRETLKEMRRCKESDWDLYGIKELNYSLVNDTLIIDDTTLILLDNKKIITYKGRNFSYKTKLNYLMSS